jgi:hypothetical protein
MYNTRVCVVEGLRSQRISAVFQRRRLLIAMDSMSSALGDAMWTV